jgi:hypothetical protein
MTLLMNHVWLVGLLVMFVNIVVGRVRMQAMITDGALTEREANCFCINASVVLAVMCGLFGAITVYTGLPAHCQLLLPFTDRRTWSFYGLTVLCGAALLFWIWRRGGGQTLARIGPAFARGAARDKRYTPQQVRFWTTATLVIAWGGYIAMRLAMPMPTPAEMPSCEQVVAVQPAVAADGASPPAERHRWADEGRGQE